MAIASMGYFAAIMAMIALTIIAYWRGNPVIFMITAGIAIMVGLYTPDALAALGHSTIGVGIGLMLILYSFVCLALAYGNLLREGGNE